MSGEYVRSCLSRQERDTSGECRRCAIKDKHIAELEAQLETYRAENDDWAQKWLAERKENTKLRGRLIKSQSTIRFAHDNSGIRLNPNWARMMKAALEQDHE